VSDDRKAIRIEIEYDDGRTEYATDDAANQIVQWYRGAEQLACIHGAQYTGPKYAIRYAPVPTPARDRSEK
jgi:hypothetical protein